MGAECSIEEFEYLSDVNSDLYCESNGNWVEGCMNPPEPLEVKSSNREWEQF